MSADRLAEMTPALRSALDRHDRDPAAVPVYVGARPGPPATLDDLRARLGPFRALAVLHDGLAAASTRAGEPRTVVLTLGTAIGAGYPLGEEGLRPVKLGL